MRHTPQTHALIHLVRAHGMQDTDLSNRFTSEAAVQDMEEDLRRRKEIRDLKTSITEAEALLIQLKKSSADQARIARIEEQLTRLRETLEEREEKRKRR